ncbi:hypothetical protein L1887_48987 [Cichorium endivia]|nr:hypothetical protein L1887_48987 [Cichorium endivia]
MHVFVGEGLGSASEALGAVGASECELERMGSERDPEGWVRQMGVSWTPCMMDSIRGPTGRRAPNSVFLTDRPTDRQRETRWQKERGRESGPFLLPPCRFPMGGGGEQGQENGPKGARWGMQLPSLAASRLGVAAQIESRSNRSSRALSLQGQPLNAVELQLTDTLPGPILPLALPIRLSKPGSCLAQHMSRVPLCLSLSRGLWRGHAFAPPAPHPATISSRQPPLPPSSHPPLLLPSPSISLPVHHLIHLSIPANSQRNPWSIPPPPYHHTASPRPPPSQHGCLVRLLRLPSLTSAPPIAPLLAYSPAAHPPRLARPPRIYRHPLEPPSISTPHSAPRIRFNPPQPAVASAPLATK